MLRTTSRLPVSGPKSYPRRIVCNLQFSSQDSGGKIAALIAGIGNSSTVIGAGNFLKEKNPGLRF